MKIEITPELIKAAGFNFKHLEAVLAIIERDYTIARRWVRPPDDPELCGAVSPSRRMTCREKKGHDLSAVTYRRHWGLNANGARRAWKEWLR